MRASESLKLLGLVLLILGVGLASSIELGVASATQTQACQSWERTFGGSKNEYSRSVQQTTDGGFILLGYRFDAGKTFIWLIKVDAQGNKEWERTFSDGGDDYGYSIQQTADGGFILLGYTWSFGAGGADFWLIKTDAQGNKEWERTFGGSGDDYGLSVQQTSDGGFILLGYTHSNGEGKDFWLIKTDSQGNKEWERTFGGSGDDYGTSVQQTADGGFILLGYTNSYGKEEGRWDLLLIKTDSQGNKEWEKTFAKGSGFSVQQTADGGYILLGYTERGPWLIKTDAQGDKEWDRTFGRGDSDEGYSVQQTSDGGFVLLGGTNSHGTRGWDFWLVKIDAQGNKEWEKTFGSSDSEKGYSVQQTSDGGYILFGGKKSFSTGRTDLWLIKYCPEG